jgi:hypothetical protein
MVRGLIDPLETIRDYVELRAINSERVHREPTKGIIIVIPSTHLTGVSLDDLGALIRKLAADCSTPWQIPKLTEIERTLEICGAVKLVIGSRQEDLPSSTGKRL